MKGETVTFKELGQIVYEAYNDTMEQALRLKYVNSWLDLHPAEKAAWRAAALEALRVQEVLRRHGMGE